MILAVDTSGEGLSLAVGRTHKDAVSRRIRKCSSDERMFPELKRLLARAQSKFSDIKAIAAACGPGRFTGIRMGMTFAEMFARSLKKPFVAINRFEAWAAVSTEPAAKTKRRSYKCVVFPAGRGDLFFQLFKIGTEGRHIAVGEPHFALKDQGEAAIAAVCQGKQVVMSRYDFEESPFPGFPAAFLIDAAREKLRKKRTSSYKPLYLRPAGYELLHVR